MFASTYSSSVCWGWHVVLAAACRQSCADVHVPELDVGPVIHVLTLVVLLGFVILEIFGWLVLTLTPVIVRLVCVSVVCCCLWCRQRWQY